MLTASVVISCYNQEHYVEECVLSVISQEVDFEYDIIISDDSSTDNTQDKLRMLANRYRHIIKLNLRTKNVGAAKNYTELHRLADGDIIYHLDGDDVMLPGKMQNQYDVFKKDPEVNIVFHNAEYFSDDGTYVSNTNFLITQEKQCAIFSQKDLARWGTIAVHSSYAYRKTSRKTTFLEREFMEWFFAMDSLIPKGKGVFLRSRYIKYRSNPEPGSYLSTLSGRYKAYCIYLNDIKILFKDNPELRLDLFSNFVVTFLTMLKLHHKTPLVILVFMLKNMHYFRPIKFLDTIKNRSTVGPSLKLR
jgi:glycosyltransferase involved in cell wall biosynthesis